jgi:FtsP/CotA-like multicopper oxidase with cupredoxin domain
MEQDNKTSNRLNRRGFLKTLFTGGLAVAGVVAGEQVARAQDTPASAHKVSQPVTMPMHAGEIHSANGTVGSVNHAANGFDPSIVLHEWDLGKVSTLESGQTLREYNIIAQDKEVEVAPGVFFPAWTYNGRIPGPTIRCVEGDHLRITFVNAGTHPHTLHFHGFHAANMDGVPGIGAGEIPPGGVTVYEFDAGPFGCHLYHCHASPLKRHIHKGLYGAFIIDPDPAKYTGEEAEIAKPRNHLYPESKSIHEMVMVMNGFDTNFDGENEVYAANSIAFGYMQQPIAVKKDQLQRLYLINLTEFDPINSLHLHGNFFNYYDHGTTLQPTNRMVDTIMQCQGQRGILEFHFKGFESGRYMFHAHQSELAELGWMGFFEVGD